MEKNLKINGSSGSGDCLGCGRRLPDPFLDLGRTPLANSFIVPGKIPSPEKAYRLAVAFCAPCSLVQLCERVPPHELFSDYIYFSSFSESFLLHAKEMAKTMVQRFHLDSTKRVLEIASNDGYLLKFFKHQGVQVLGVEPARNIAEEAIKNGIPTLAAFFGPQLVQKLLEDYGKADLIIGNNVLAHVPSINNFLGAIRNCLDPNGTAIFEFPHLMNLLDEKQFDTIYHEHVFYYSLSAVKILAERNGLELSDVEKETVHGGSLRVFLQHSGKASVANGVPDMLEIEKAEGLTHADRYQSFSKAVDGVKCDLIDLLKGLKSSGKRLAAYGAPAKGNTLLNTCGIGTALIDFTVDRSPYKQGRLLPGSHIPVEHPDQILDQMPDYVLILPWNLAEEIMEQQKEFHKKGGKFIIPIPELRIV